MLASREMTLDEYVAQLPTSHRARKEYMALRSPGAGAMREAAAIECDALEHDFKVEADDAERKGLFNQENDYAMRSYGARACAAAIRALPLPAPEVPDKHSAFGLAVWDGLKKRIVDGDMDEADMDLADSAVKAGLCEWVSYDPDTHGQIEYAEPGDMIYWWGGR